MMHVVFTRDFRYWKAQEEAEVPDELAEQWREAGICQPVPPAVASRKAKAP